VAASTASEYLKGLPAERRRALGEVRALIRRHLPKGYQETVQYGMITWVVPLSRYPAGYLGKKDVPLPYVSLASQKRHMAVYLMGLSGDARLQTWFQAAWKKTGKKLDLGKSCLRFEAVDDLALPVLGEAIARLPVDDFVALYEKSRGG
jgi:hypothetical protein